MSNRLKALREKQADLIDKYDALITAAETAKRNLTPEERATRDGYASEIELLGGDIKAEEKLIQFKLETARPQSIEQPGAKGLPPRIHTLKNIKGERAVERAETFGRWCMGTMFGHKKSLAWCEERGLIVRAQSEGVNADGGYFVPDEISMEIITLRDSYGLARQLLTVYPMGRDTMTIPKWVSGLTMYFVGEGVAGTESSAKWTQVRLVAEKAMILVLFSRELDEDAAISIGDILAGEIAYAMAKGEDTILFAGDGTAATYGGMMGLRTIFNTGVGSLAGAVDAAAGNDTMAEITAADLAKAQGALPQYVYDRGNPMWFCSQTMWANVFERLIGASGGVTKDQASGRTIREYNGYPVRITPAMLAPAAPTTDTSDVAMILFGDLAMAVAMGDRRGLTIDRSTEYKFAQDQVAIKGTERFHINAHATGDTTTAGPIVALMGE